MTKRIIALLLALILTVGLLPTVALAADGTATPIASVSGNDSTGNVHVKKEIYQNDDGTYKVRLESWATGTQTVVKKHLPMDIVLVLDVSGSMETEDVVSFAGTKTQVSRNESNENLKNKAVANNLFVLVDGNYYPVTVKRNPSYGEHGPNTQYTYSYTKDGSTFDLGTYSGGRETYTGSMLLYSVQSNNYISRLEALKNAVNAFIDSVADDTTKSEVDHKISIVKFAGTEKTETGNEMYNNNEYNYTQIVKNLTPANVAHNVTELKAAVTALNYGGATRADFGMNRAAAALGTFTSEGVKTRGRIVIMFTDGEPTNFRNYDNGVAGDAVAKAKELKDKGAKVYTIAMIDSANPSDTSGAINRYMNGVSSNYPQATKFDYGYSRDHWYHYGVDLGTRGDGSYYQAASSSADSLAKIFDAISKDISNNTTTLGESAILFDELPDNFELPANAQDITTKTASYTAEGTWGADTTVTDLTITKKNNGGRFEISGFDYAENWCGKRTDNTYDGKKLIVEFTIKHDNYGGTQPTNKTAGIGNAEDNIVNVDNPQIAVPITTPSLTSITATKVYDGTGIDVLENVAAEANKLVTGENEGKNNFVDIIVKVKDENNTEYIYTIPAGATTGTWNPTSAEFKTPADVKIKSDGTVGNYSYTLSITYQDKTQTDPAAPQTATGTAEFTITKRPVTLTSETASKAYDGTPLTKPDVTVTDYNDGKNVFNSEFTASATGTITEPGGPVTNTITVTPKNGAKESNYEITKQEGTLTITKDASKEITVTITGKQETKEYNGQMQAVTDFDYTVTGADKNDVTVTLKEGETASASGKDVKTENDGKYMMGLSASNFTVSSDKYSSVTITSVTDGWLKITPLAVTLTSESATQEYNGNALTRPTVSVTGAGAERFKQEVENLTAKGTVIGTANMTEAESVTNTIDYTWKDGFSASNYMITTTPGTLTITPIAQLKITFKTETGGKINGGTADIEKTAKRNDSFPTIPTPEADTGYYFDGWYKDGETTKTENFPTTVTENATYTAKWSSYTPIVLNLTGKIQKTLKSDVVLSNEDFTINLKLSGTEVASATATATVSATASGTGYTGTAPFQTAGDEFKLTFSAPDTYKYYIAEQDGHRAGMTYDVGFTNGHVLSVEVKATDNHALFFGEVTIDGTEVKVNDENTTTWLTITNNYVEPKETFDLNTLITKNFTAAADSKPIPTGTYEFKAQIVETDSSWNKLDSGATYEGTATLHEGGSTSFDFGANRNLTLTAGDHYYLVCETSDTVSGATGTITYDKLTYSLKITVDSNGNVAVEVLNYVVVSSLAAENTEEFAAGNHITFVNYYFEEKDPGTYTIDFSNFIRKELTKTGDRSFNGAEFTATVDGWHVGKIEISMMSTATRYNFAPLSPVTLKATFPADTTFDADGRAYQGFTGDKLTVPAGEYLFLIDEINDGQTNITYDESKYWLALRLEEDLETGEVSLMGVRVREFVEGDTKETVVEAADWTDVYASNYAVTFENTINTGKDDYYPIIIPTIINKDTGMLNKTDHFAYVIGYPDGTVHPNGQITRAEVATIFFRLLRDEVRDGAFTTSNSYSDVAYGKWYNNPISTMSALGIITGYPDGTFKPDKPITRAEFAAIAARFDETQSGKSATFSDVIGHWAAKEIGIAYYNDWIKGYPDGTFKPDQNITRAEAMTLINRVLERKPESPSDLLSDMNVWTDNMDTSKWYYLDVQEATNSHSYTRKTFNYELWRSMLPDPDWSRYER